jgi:hypothetical protein
MPIHGRSKVRFLSLSIITECRYNDLFIPVHGFGQVFPLIVINDLFLGYLP